MDKPNSLEALDRVMSDHTLHQRVNNSVPSNAATLVALQAEILAAITDHLFWASDISHLMLACKRFAELLTSQLYRADAVVCVSVDYAIKTNNTELLRTALSTKRLLPRKKHLLAAIKSANLDAVALLMVERTISEELDLESLSGWPNNCIMDALSAKNLAATKLLYRHAKKQTYPITPSGTSILFDMIEAGDDVNAVKLLVEEGEDALVRDADGQTTLDAAFWKFRLNIARYLIDLKVPHTLDTSGESDDLSRLVRHAVNRRQLDVIEFVAERWPIDLVSINAADEGELVLLASHRGNKAIIQRFLDLTVNIVAENKPYDKNPFTAALCYDHIEIAELLLDLEVADWDLDEDKNTTLHLAARFGSSVIVQACLEGGADPNSITISSDSAVEGAVRLGHIDCFHLLVRYGADWRRNDGTGRTLLMKTTSPTIARWLIENGTDPLARDSEGATALQFACKRGDIDMVNFLIPVIQAKGQSAVHLPESLLTSAVKGHSRAVTRLIAALPTTNSDIGRADAFMEALASARLDVAEFLYNLGISVDYLNSIGQSALYLAAFHRAPEHIIIGLLEGGADPNQTELIHAFGSQAISTSPWLETCNSPSPSAKMVKVYLDHAADVHATKDGWSILHLLASRLSVEALAVILEQGLLDVNISPVDPNFTQLTPLDCALKNNLSDGSTMRIKLQTLRLLLSYGGSTIFLRPETRATPPVFPMDVYRCFSDEIVKTLVIDAHMDINSTNESMETILHLAANHDRDNIILPLLFCGADVDAVDDEGRSAFDRAERYDWMMVMWAIIVYKRYVYGEASVTQLWQRLRVVQPRWIEDEIASKEFELFS